MIVITDIKYMLSFFVVKCLKYVVNGKKKAFPCNEACTSCHGKAADTGVVLMYHVTF